jgi:hypothetical protein
VLTVIVHIATHAGAAEQQAQHALGFTALSVDAAAIILAYAGGNNWLGNATVCTRWRDTYTAVATSRHSSNSSSNSSSSSVDTLHCTDIAIAFASHNWLSVALAAGLPLRSGLYNETVVKHADTALLRRALVQGHMPLTEATVSAAVEARDLDKLKLLHAHDCPMPHMVSAEVAGTGNMAMLK